ncbi:MAG: YdeI/OmpD-associated family protein [Chthoniobacterales bacterium]
MAKSEKGASQPIFFATPNEFRAWLEKNHAAVKVQWVGFYRKASGRASITWPESVDEALCVGWIDGLRKGIDSASYMIRFTPRTATSAWSEINIGRVAVLVREGRMLPAGEKAFAARLEKKSGVYSYEQRKNPVLDKNLERRFRKNSKAWKFFHAQSPSYRKMMTWYVISAKLDATRQKRLDRVIAESEAGRRIR